MASRTSFLPGLTRWALGMRPPGESGRAGGEGAFYPRAATPTRVVLPCPWHPTQTSFPWRAAMTIARDFELTWLGHAAFRLRTPGDRIVLLDPWIENPACPADLEPFDRVDLILISHGHSDHLGQSVEL